MLPVELIIANTGPVNVCTWRILQPPPAGMVIKWLFLTYRYTTKPHYDKKHSGFNIWWDWLPEMSGQFIHSGLLPGKYLYNLSGAYGYLDDPLSSFTIFHLGNEVVIT